MSRRTVVLYQWLAGLSDTVTGLLLIMAPGLTLRLMGLHAEAAALPFVSFVGAFVLAVGLAYLYGGLPGRGVVELEVVWALTAITRGSVAVVVIAKIMAGSLESGWITVGVFDGVLALFQATGLMKGWLRR